MTSVAREDLIAIDLQQAFLLYCLSRFHAAGALFDAQVAVSLLHLLADDLRDLHHVPEALPLYRSLPRPTSSDGELDWDGWLDVFDQKVAERLMDERRMFALNDNGCAVGRAIHNGQTQVGVYVLDQQARAHLTPTVKRAIAASASTYRNLRPIEIIAKAKAVFCIDA